MSSPNDDLTGTRDYIMSLPEKNTPRPYPPLEIYRYIITADGDDHIIKSGVLFTKNENIAHLIVGAMYPEYFLPYDSGGSGPEYSLVLVHPHSLIEDELDNGWVEASVPVSKTGYYTFIELVDGKLGASMLLFMEKGSKPEMSWMTHYTSLLEFPE